MSMYNMLFGANPSGPMILATLGLTPQDTGRYRDCYIDGGLIAVYTRNGGGNREDYQETIDALSKNENYLSDEDDDFDSTYCTIYFTFPKEYESDLSALEQGIPPSEKWKALFEQLGK